MAWLRSRGQGFDVARVDHGEVAVVEGGDLGDVEPLGYRDHGRVGRAEGWSVYCSTKSGRSRTWSAVPR